MLKPTSPELKCNDLRDSALWTACPACLCLSQAVRVLLGTPTGSKYVCESIPASGRGQAGLRAPLCPSSLPFRKVFSKRLGHHLWGPLSRGALPGWRPASSESPGFSGCELCPPRWDLPACSEVCGSFKPVTPVACEERFPIEGRYFFLISQGGGLRWKWVLDGQEAKRPGGAEAEAPGRPQGGDGV